jgi:hypothetical protein
MSDSCSVPKRPGISETTLIAAGVQYSDYPEEGSIVIPYWTREGEMTEFKRWRLPSERANGQKYHQEPGTGVYVYYPPGFYRRNGIDGKFGLSRDALVLVEGEFKDLSLLELGIYSIGLPSFVVYTNDENGNRQLLRDLQVTLSKEKPKEIYFLGDSDTATNFEFARQAAFLSGAAFPSQVLLPRIPISRPKGIDDCKEDLGEEFGEFFTELITTAIPLDRKINETALALMLLERELNHLKALQGPERERQFRRLVQLVGAAQRCGETNATARVRKLIAKLLGITATELKAAVKAEYRNEGEPRKQKQASRKERSPGARLELILPGHHVEVTQCARNCFPVLAKTHRYFMRERTVFELGTISKDGARLVPVEPDGFCSQLENHFILLSFLKVRDKLELVRRCCSTSDATKLLKCDVARELLPPIKLVTAAPVFVEQDGRLEILSKGYHSILGGIYVTREYSISKVPLTEAVQTIKSISVDYLFVAPSDRSRFIAGLIAPALRQGGLIEDDFPVTINEADQSQTGKTYALKVLCALYNEQPFTVTLKEERTALGSHDELLSKGMIEAHPFIMWENARGLVSSQLAESAIRGTGTVTCRIAYMAPVEVATDKFMWLLSSNKADITPDLAARALITRMLKQPASHKYHLYDGGHDLLKEVRHNSTYYLSCILAIVSAWVDKGKPRTDDRRHDFREACQALDWIVQHIFKLAPLLNDHQNEQARVSNPLLNWLRDLALLVKQDESLEKPLRTSEINEICANHGLSIPHCRLDANDDDRNLALGRLFKNLFKASQTLSLSGFTVDREVSQSYNFERQEYIHTTHYTFKV